MPDVSALPPSGRRALASCEDITPRSSLLRTHSPIPFGSPPLRPLPREEVFAGCYQPLLPTGSSRRYSANLSSDAWALTTAVPLSAFACFFLRVIGLPHETSGSASRYSPRTRLLAVSIFETADISLCSGLRVCSPPRSFLPLRILPQGSRGFYFRAERASLPPHASDMLAVRIQAIDGARTFTLQDSQPCRLLPFHVLTSPDISSASNDT